jgi:actin-binding protein IPP
MGSSKKYSKLHQVFGLFWKLRLEKSNMEKDKNYALSLLSKLNTFQKDTLFCDGIIKIAGKQFSIHKVILSAASPYFRTLFCNGMVETFSLEVELQGVESECFGLLLGYIYTGNITVTSSNVVQLVDAGRLFQLDDIVEYCCDFLISELTVENCLGILSLGQLHSCIGLSATILNYVHLHFEEVCKNEEFLQLDWSILLSFLESDSIKISSEDDVFIAVLKWVTYDTENRCRYIKQLLDHVKLPLVSPRIAETHCALCQDDGSMIYEAYSACLQEQLLCSKISTCPRTYSKRYFYIIGGLIQRQDGTLLDPLESLANVERCEVPAQTADANLSFEFLQTNNVQPMNQPRNSLAVTSLNGLLYAIGGEDESFIYDSVECYNPIVDQWIVRGSMLSPRVNHGACVIDGEIYVLGGWIGETIARTMEKYNPGEDTWVVVGNIPTPRSDAGVCEVNGLIYIIGMYWDYGDMNSLTMSVSNQSVQSRGFI